MLTPLLTWGVWEATKPAVKLQNQSRVPFLTEAGLFFVNSGTNGLLKSLLLRYRRGLVPLPDNQLLKQTTPHAQFLLEFAHPFVRWFIQPSCFFSGTILDFTS
jgi:hypothetical protein